MKVEIEVPKESYELAVGLGRFVKALKTALADGWQMGTDLPVAVTSVITDVVPSIQGFDQIGSESKADPMGVGLAVIEGLRPVFKKD